MTSKDYFTLSSILSETLFPYPTRLLIQAECSEHTGGGWGGGVRLVFSARLRGRRLPGMVGFPR